MTTTKTKLQAHEAAHSCPQPKNFNLPVQEDERLFSQNNKDCVAKLRNFWQNEHKCPKTRNTVLFNKTEIKKNAQNYLQYFV